MFEKIKYFVSAVFNTDSMSNAKFLPPPNMFLRVKKHFPFARKNITPPLKVKRYSCLRKMLQKLE